MISGQQEPHNFTAKQKARDTGFFMVAISIIN